MSLIFLNTSLSIIRITFFAALALLGVIFGVYSGFSSFERIEYRRVEINKASVIAQVAADVESRRLGLADKKNIAPNYGLLFMFAKQDYHGLWMKGMNFPVDIFWIKNNQVVDLEENILPPRNAEADDALPIYKPDAPASMVLEVKAGFAKRNNVKIGDEVKVFPLSLESGLLASQISGPVDDYLGFKSSGKLPGSEFFIENLREKSAQGKDFKIEQELERNKIYQKFSISYKSGGLKINGRMSVPSVQPPAGGFPILILNRDLPENNSDKIQDFFARRGYVAILSDYQGTSSSSLISLPATEYDFYVGYTQNVVNLLDALKKLAPDLDAKLNKEKVGVWGQGVGGFIASRLMVLRPEVKAYVLFASLSARVEDNFYKLPEKEKTRLQETYGPEEKGVYSKISPLTYFSYVSAPVQLHHGVLDEYAPLSFSEKIFAGLSKGNKKVEFFKYPGEGHDLTSSWTVAAERSLEFFNHYLEEKK